MERQNLGEPPMTNEKKCIYIIEDDATINHGIELTLGNENMNIGSFIP